ncbi:MAG: hypothetical protein WCE75_07260 [Terracidiphilus sp.]
MELLDRYLQAVRKHLPFDRQDDIVAELKANLEAQLEDREAALGRPLTRGEAEDWLREIGPPMQVAFRYRRQQWLIGPAVFPMYLYVLRLGVTWWTIIYAIVSAVQIALAQDRAGELAGALLRLPGLLFWVLAWVTAVFAAIEFAGSHLPKVASVLGGGRGAEWSPAALPPVETKAAGGRKPRTFAQAVAEVVFGFLGLIWLLLVPGHPYLLLGPAAGYLKTLPFTPAPVLYQFYWWVVALAAAQLVWHAVELALGTWQRPRKLRETMTHLLGLVPLLLLFTAPGHLYLVLRQTGADPASAANVDAINKYIYLSVSVVFFLVVLQVVAGLASLGRDLYRRRAGQGK